MTIEKCQAIIIPAFGNHHDETYFHEPEKFDPTYFFIQNDFGNSNVLRNQCEKLMAFMNCKSKMGKSIQTFLIEL